MTSVEKELNEVLDKLFDSQRRKLQSFVEKVVKREVKEALKRDKSSSSDKKSSGKKRAEKSESSSSESD